MPFIIKFSFFWLQIFKFRYFYLISERFISLSEAIKYWPFEAGLIRYNNRQVKTYG